MPERLALPKPQCVHDAVFIAENGHVVGNGAHRLIGKAHDDSVALHSHAPGIAPLEPVVPFLMLEAVFKRLTEEPVTVTDAVAVECNVLARRRFQIASRKSAESAVAECGILHFLKLVEILADALQSVADLFQNPEVEQIGIDRTAHKKLCREIPAAAAVGFFLLAPVRVRLLHDRLGDGIVKFLSARALHIAGIVRIENAFHIRKKYLLIEFHFIHSLKSLRMPRRHNI